MNHTDKVKQFTEESMGVSVPRYPKVMDREQVIFLTRMCCEEIMEFLCTIKEEGEDVKTLLQSIVDKSNLPTKNQKPDNDIDVIAEQVDFGVDIYYYMLNSFCKHGMNADKIFDLVHDANMNKRFSDGTFHRNEIGKVIKPPDWKEADIKNEIERWVKDGTWA